MLQQQPLQRVAALQPAKLKDGRHPQRDRDDRRPQILFIFILMQRQFCARTIAVNQTGVGGKLRIAAGGGRRQRQFMKYGRHRRPGLIGYRVDRGVQIALAIGSPAQRAAVGHGDRHGVPARRDHLAKRRLTGDVGYRLQQRRGAFAGKSPQHHRAGGQRLLPRWGIAKQIEHYSSSCWASRASSCAFRAVPQR